MSKQKKQGMLSEDLVENICDIIKTAYKEFGNAPEVYRAVTIRMVNILLKQRPRNFPKDWK